MFFGKEQIKYKKLNNSFSRVNIVNIDQCKYDPECSCEVLFRQDKSVFTCQLVYSIKNQNTSCLEETIINLNVGGRSCPALLDTGADSSVLGFQLLTDLIPDWDQFQNFSGAPTAMAAGGHKIDIIAHKSIPVKIGQFQRLVNFYIIDGPKQLILGLEALKTFNVKIVLKAHGVQVYCNNKPIPTVKQIQDSLYCKNDKKIKLYPQQTKHYLIKNKQIKNKQLYLVTTQSGPSLTVPSLSEGEDGHLLVSLFNNLQKKALVKKFQLIFKIQKIQDTDYKIHPFPRTPGVHQLYAKCTPFVHTGEHNRLFYAEKPIKISFFSELFEKSTNNEKKTMDTLADLSVLPGYSLPEDIQFPLQTVEQILQNSFNECCPEDKDFIIKQFLKYPNIVSRFALDCGLLKSYDGQPILLKIPLKQNPLPKFTKFYTLPPDQQEELDTIFDFLLHYRLVEEAPPDARCGNPCFLIARHGDDQRPSRLVIDCRRSNLYIDEDVSTASEDILEYLKEILKSEYISSFDAANAFHSLRLHPETLNSNLTNVITRKRAYRFLVSCFGLANLPFRFNDILRTQLALSDQGHYSPIRTLLSFFDDLFVLTKNGGKYEHRKQLQLFFYRISRLNMKLSPAKALCFRNVQNDTFKILGYSITKGRLAPARDKITTISQFPLPQTKTELQKFLGYVTFIRTTVPQVVLHHASYLSGLCGNSPFKMEPGHIKAFNEIKHIIQEAECFIESGANSILLIYVDASESMYGSVAFAYNPGGEDGLICRPVDNPDLLPAWDLLNYREHTRNYHLKLKYLQDQFPTTDPIFERILKLTFLAFKGYPRNLNYPSTPDLLTNILNEVFANIKRVEDIFDNGSKTDGGVDNFLNLVLANKMSDDIFFQYFGQIMYLIGLKYRMNIKIIFGNKIKCSTPYTVIIDGFQTDILLGFDTESKQFTLLFIEEDYEFELWKLTSNYKVEINQAPPDTIFRRFKQTLDSTSSPPQGQRVRLIEQFSKTIPMQERHNPIYLLESLSILYACHAFRHLIHSSKISILLTDSKVSTFLFNKNIQDSNKRLFNYGIKLALSFPKLFILHCSGKNNVADIMTRVGLQKKDFFARTLTPVKVNKSILKQLQGKVMSWSQIYDFIEKNPEIVEFSDKKLPRQMKDCMYLDHGSECIKTNIFMGSNKFDILEKFLSKENIIKRQIQEFQDTDFPLANGMMTFENKIVLPRKCYAVAIRKYHLITAHGGKKKLLLSLRGVYHIIYLKDLFELTDRLVGNCIGCLIMKTAPDNYIHGLFSVQRKNQLVSIDLIENFTGPCRYLLNVVDAYSGYMTIYPLPNKTMNLIINCLINYTSMNGQIVYLHADNYFRGGLIKKFCTDQGIKLTDSSAYRSRARSHVESANFRLQFALKSILVGNNKDWQNRLGLSVHLLNNRKIKNTDLSPHILHWGFNPANVNPICPDPNYVNWGVGLTLEDIKSFLAELKSQEIIFVTERQNNNRERQLKINASKIEHNFLPGQVVLLKRRSAGPVGLVQKLREVYMPLPFQIIKVREFIIYLKGIDSGIILTRGPGDLKLVKGVNFGNYLNLLEGDIAQLSEIYDVVREDHLEDDILQLTAPINESQGVRTRRQKQSMEDRQDLLDDIILEILEDDDLPASVSFQ